MKVLGGKASASATKRRKFSLSCVSSEIYSSTIGRRAGYLDGH